MGIKVAFVTGPEEGIGIKFLSAILKERGHDVSLFCDPQLFNDEALRFQPLSKVFDLRSGLVDEICAYAPDLVAFSVFSDFFDWAVALARMIKGRLAVPVIFGGIHPTTSPEAVIATDCVDMICLGEGEYPLAELADSLGGSTRRTDIKNLWFKEGSRVIRNPLRPLIDVDQLPPPDHGIYYAKNDYFQEGYNTVASRGCPFECTYCCHSVLKPLYGRSGYYRVRSVANLMEELKTGLKAFKFKSVRFQDDLFPADKDWLRDFTRQYKKHIDRPFICCLHPAVVSEEIVSLLKQAGCVEVRLGVQTLNAEIRRNFLNRLETNQDIASAIQILKKFGIHLVAENIVGLPGQTDEDIVQALEFYNQNRPTRNHFFWLRYYPGLKIEAFRQDKGAERRRDGPSKVFTQGGDTYGKGIDPRLISAVCLMPFMSQKAFAGFMRRKAWKYVPVFFPAGLNVFSNITSRSYCDKIQRIRTTKRYAHFIGQALRRCLKTGSNSIKNEKIL